MEIMREMVDQLLLEGVIESSHSNFASPGFLVLPNWEAGHDCGGLPEIE